MDFLKHWRDIRYNNLKLLFDRQTDQLYEAIRERDMWGRRYTEATEDTDYYMKVLMMEKDK